MKVGVFQKPGTKRSFKSNFKKHNLTLNSKNPEVVISYGGDGTFLLAEKKYPGVPKLLIKHSKICKKCSVGNLNHLLEDLSKGNYNIENLIKLEVKAKKRSLIGVNDIVLRNYLLTEALRFSVKIKGKTNYFIGDGIVVATPYGSTGYFNSITNSSFKKGIGLAFNNLIGNFSFLLLPENGEIEIKIQRGEALVAADNNRKSIKIGSGDVVKIGKDRQSTGVVRIKGH